MKKVILIALAIIALGFSSCNKQETPGYYCYSNKFHLSEALGMPENNVTELDQYLVTNKFEKIFTLTKEEAEAEWESFITATEAMTIFLNEDSYYEVSFDRCEKQDQTMVPVENIGKKRWGNGN